jgi:hypothetical protein
MGSTIKDKKKVKDEEVGGKKKKVKLISVVFQNCPSGWFINSATDFWTLT